MLKIKNVLLVGFFFAADKTQCQSPGQNQNTGVEVARMQFQAKQVIPPSPEAAELGKYGNVPVSLFTGTPNISIPMVELKGNALSIPVSLSYNASGFKPEDIAPWTGLGWALNAGGVITRSVAGNPDRTNNYFTSPSPMIIPGTQDEFARQAYYADIRNKVKETQPDMYYYNFMGHSGKFLIQPDGQIFKKVKDMLQISTTVAADDTQNSFTITDDQGIKYEFTEMEKTSMVDVDDGEGAPPMMSYNFTSAWYLTRVESPYGAEELLFEYYSPTDPQQMFNGVIANRAESYSVSQSVTSPVIFNNWTVEGTVTESIPPSVSIWKKFIKKITHKKSGAITGYIEFESETNQREDLWLAAFDGERLLRNVKLYSTSNETSSLIKNFELEYTYSTTSGSEGEKRLLLETVQEKSVRESTPDKPPYKFSYNTTSLNMPPRFSSALDHWGFYNGVENYNTNGLKTLVPTININCCTNQALYGPRGNGANREPDFDAANLCMINKITYPTGGYTSFEFEGHDAIEENGTAYHAVGGIRIKRMIDYSFLEKPAVVKTYEYKNADGATSGKIGQACIRYDDYSNFKTKVCFSGVSVSNTETYTVTIAANSIYGLGSVQGSHVGYERVTEYQNDLLTDQSLGKTVYNYNTTFYSQVDDDIRNGDLLHQEVYRNDGKLLQEQVNTYTYTNNPTPMVRRKLRPLADQSNANILCKDASGNIHYYYAFPCNDNPACVMSTEVKTQYLADDYTINMQNKQLIQQVQTVYDQLGDLNITTTKNISYGNATHTYPTLISEITSNGDNVNTSIKYIADYPADPGTASGTIGNNIYLMHQKNQMALPVEKLQYRQDNNGIKKYLNGQLTDYIYGNPSKIYFLEAKPLLANIAASDISSHTFNFDSHYRLAASIGFDSMMNINQQSKTGDAAKSYIWDYNASYPVAEISGASSDQVAYTSFETNSKGGFTFTGTPIFSHHDDPVPTGKYYYNLAGQEISRTVNSSEKYTVSYWSTDAAHPYSVSGSTSYKQGQKINGWTYFEHTVSGVNTVTISGGKYIDELRLYPSIAQMNTVTYEPMIGETSRADVNNNIIYYNYDGLSRLINVKDEHGNIVKNFGYNYAPNELQAPEASLQTLFYNAAIEQDFEKEGCPVGTHGDVLTYKIPYGRYVGVTQQAADAKAELEIETKGQANANTNGLCLWYNELIHEKVFKANCLPVEGPGLWVWFDIPVGDFKSIVSQNDADNQAIAYFFNNRQAYANSHATCSCVAEGQRFISDTCETGTRINKSTVLVSGNPPQTRWKCTYIYTFSDGHNSGEYYEYSSDPCGPNQ